MKLLTYLQQYHHYSRRQCVRWIQDKKVTYDDQIVDSFATQVEEGKCLSIQDAMIDHVVHVVSNPSSIYPWYKPKGYVVSKSDTHNHTIYEILDAKYRDRYYIGRLDKESHGLLLLTNDPKLVHQYEHPSQDIHKIYRVVINQSLSQGLIHQLCQSNKVVADTQEGREYLSFDKLHYQAKNGQHILIITLNEGKNRHIRRLLQHFDIQVLDLCRIQHGSYMLQTIRPDLKL